jgi:negative regulator of flagellin synthesis FlgM
MPRIGQGFEVGPANPLRPIEPRIAQAAGSGPQAPGKTQASAAAKATNVLDPGEPPIDAERVGLIRKAVENGTYPVVPAQIADAIIAAGMLLRSPSHG